MDSVGFKWEKLKLFSFVSTFHSHLLCFYLFTLKVWFTRFLLIVELDLSLELLSICPVVRVVVLAV